MVQGPVGNLFMIATAHVDPLAGPIRPLLRPWRLTISTPVKRPYAVAVVDDDPKVGRALARLLTALGYRAEIFASAESFMNAAATLDVTCLIIDIHLGSDSGLELARWVSDFGFEIPIIFVTGSGDDTIRTACIDFGCIAFLRKPIAEEQLTAAIAEAIRTRLATPTRAR